MITRTPSFLADKAPYWPLASAEVGAVSEHISRALAYVSTNVELGPHGLIGMGTGDFGGALLKETSGTDVSETFASVFNSAVVVHGLPLLAEVLGSVDGEAADDFAELVTDQVTALEEGAWNGAFYERAFTESGVSMTPETMFAATQALPVLAEIGDEERRHSLLDALSPSPVSAVAGGPVRPAINAWVTEAHATRDPAIAWQSLVENSLAAHADRTPEYAYGVWTGPGSYAGLDQDEPGSATLFGPRPEADFPAASTEVHMAMVRASLSLMGILANPTGWRIEPKFPSETFSVVLPNLELNGTPNSIGGSITAQAVELMQMVVTLPSGARGGELMVKVKEAEVEFELGAQDTVTFTIPVREEESVKWSVTGL